MWERNTHKFSRLVGILLTNVNQALWLLNNNNQLERDVFTTTLGGINADSLCLNSNDNRILTMVRRRENKNSLYLSYTSFLFVELYNSKATVDYRLLQNILKLSLYETFVSVRVGGYETLVTVSFYNAVAASRRSSSALPLVP